MTELMILGCVLAWNGFADEEVASYKVRAVATFVIAGAILGSVVGVVIGLVAG